MNKILGDLTDLISEALECRDSSTERPFVVAIDGRSGVGKSTIARFLRDRLNAASIAGDDFFAGETRARSDIAMVLADICIDRARLRAVLENLRSKRRATYFPFDWDTFDGTLAKQATVVEPARDEPCRRADHDRKRQYWHGYELPSVAAFSSASGSKPAGLPSNQPVYA